MTTNLLAALKKLRAVTNEFFDALEHELRGEFTALSPPPAAAPATTRVVPKAPGPRPTQPTPAPIVTARRPTPALDAAGLALHLPTATAIALKVLRVLGATNPQVRDGVFAQLALERIPQDPKLIADAIAAATLQLQ